jgi:hypothetical protein
MADKLTKQGRPARISLIGSTPGDRSSALRYSNKSRKESQNIRDVPDMCRASL